MPAPEVKKQKVKSEREIVYGETDLREIIIANARKLPGITEDELTNGKWQVTFEPKPPRVVVSIIVDRDA